MSFHLDTLQRPPRQTTPRRVPTGVLRAAGVIGRRKFAYDLWGDTVNTASRLESQGSPNRIQVTEAVDECLHDRYRFPDVHVVDPKGKGPTPTRFLLGRSEAPTDNGHR